MTIFDDGAYRLVRTVQLSADADDVRYDARGKHVIVGYGGEKSLYGAPNAAASRRRAGVPDKKEIQVAGPERRQDAAGPESAQERWTSQAQGRPGRPMGHDRECTLGICFSFRKGDAHDVEIVDYHRG